jgi:hypothetical protein
MNDAGALACEKLFVERPLAASPQEVDGASADRLRQLAKEEERYTDERPRVLRKAVHGARAVERMIGWSHARERPTMIHLPAPMVGAAHALRLHGRVDNGVGLVPSHVARVQQAYL